MFIHLEILGIPVIHFLIGKSETEEVEEDGAEEPNGSTFGFILPPQVEV